MSTDALDTLRDGLVDLGAAEGDDIGAQVVEVAVALKANRLSVGLHDEEDGTVRVRIGFSGGTQEVSLYCERELLQPLMARMAPAPRDVGDVTVELLPDGREGLLGWCLDGAQRARFPKPRQLGLPNAEWLERTLLQGKGPSHGLMLVGAPTAARLGQLLGAVTRAARRPYTNTVVFLNDVGPGNLPWAMTRAIAPPMDAASTLKSALRQDPDVIIVEGSAAELELASMAALTGHLVVLGLLAESFAAMPATTEPMIHSFFSAEGGPFEQWTAA